MSAPAHPPNSSTADSHAHHHHEDAHYHHEDGHHHHAPQVDSRNLRRVGLAALLTGLFMIAEIIGGLISGSLALLADAGHMLTDFAALSLALGAFLMARRPANWRHTFGYDRFSILVAFVNGLSLFGVAIWIALEAGQRFLSPSPILSGPMLYVAIGGLVVNLLVFWILLGADQHNLNIRGAVLHVMGDLLGSVAAIAAALIIMATGWVMADPLLSILVAVLILRSAWGLVRDSGHILLQGAPDSIDRRLIIADLLEHIPELRRVEHVHAWAVTPERPIVTLNAYIAPEASLELTSQAIKARLVERFHIDHATVDVMRDEKPLIKEV